MKVVLRGIGQTTFYPRRSLLPRAAAAPSFVRAIPIHAATGIPPLFFNTPISSFRMSKKSVKRQTSIACVSTGGSSVLWLSRCWPMTDPSLRSPGRAPRTRQRRQKQQICQLKQGRQMRRRMSARAATRKYGRTIQYILAQPRFLTLQAIGIAVKTKNSRQRFYINEEDQERRGCGRSSTSRRNDWHNGSLTFCINKSRFGILTRRANNSCKILTKSLPSKSQLREKRGGERFKTTTMRSWNWSKLRRS